MPVANAPIVTQPHKFRVSRPPLNRPPEETTVRLTVVACVALVPVPFTVIEYVPGVVAAPAATVMVEDPPAVTDEGLKLTVVPAGWPLAERLTVWAEPYVTAAGIAEVPLAPR